MDMMDLLTVKREDVHLIIDARDAIRKGFHPRHEILKLVDESPRAGRTDSELGAAWSRDGGKSRSAPTAAHYADSPTTP